MDCLKLENFNGTNFNALRWKVIFGMQLLKIYYVISAEKPKFDEEFKKTGRCFNCDNQGHFAKACKALKKEEKEEAHNVNQINNFVATSPSNNFDW